MGLPWTLASILASSFYAKRVIIIAILNAGASAVALDNTIRSLITAHSTVGLSYNNSTIIDIKSRRNFICPRRSVKEQHCESGGDH
jgi:hypothetical protein